MDKTWVISIKSDSSPSAITHKVTAEEKDEFIKALESGQVGILHDRRGKHYYFPYKIFCITIWEQKD